ncbi:MAG: FUSC family protein [Flavobacteriales bacterium]
MDTPENRKSPLRRTGKELKNLVRLKNQPWRWRVGIQSGLALGFPMGIFTLFGQPQWGSIAMLGAFTALYCPTLDRWDRLRVLPYVGLGLVLSSILGILFSFHIAASMLCVIAVTALASTLCQGIGMPPPGTVFFVLLAAVSSNLAGLHAHNGELVAPWWIPVLVSAGAVGAVLVVAATSLLPNKQETGEEEAVLPPSFKRFELDSETTAITIRLTVGVALALLVGPYLGTFKSYWVVLPVVAILQMGHNRHLTLTRGIQRIIGTLMGVGLFAVLLQLPHPPAGLVLIVMFFQFAAEVVITRNYALGLFFITPLALFITTVGHPIDPEVVVRDRVINTVVGIGIAIVVYLISQWIQGLKWRKAVRALASANQGEGGQGTRDTRAPAMGQPDN